MTRAKDISKILTDADLSGTLDVAGTVTAGAVAVDNITIDATEIDSTSALTLDSAGTISLDADSGSINLLDGGVTHAELINSSNDFIIKSSQSDKDIIFKGVDGISLIEAMRIDMSAGGKVGIGTGSPATNLHISGTGTGLPVTSGTTQTYGRIRTSGSGSNVVLDIGNAGATGAWLQVANQTNLGSESSLLLNPNGGNVGIGTSSPSDPLHVYLASGQRVARFEANSSTSAHISFKANNTSLMPTVGVKDEDLYFSTGDAVERMRITTGGNVGIGTSSPSQKLDVNGTIVASTVSSQGARIERNGTTGGANFDSVLASGSLHFRTGATERMRIDSSGNVGIGGGPNNWGGMNRTLELIGSNDVELVIHANSDSLSNDGRIGQVSFLAGTTNTLPNVATIVGRVSGTDEAKGVLSFHCRDTDTGGLPQERVRIDSSGNVGIGGTSFNPKLYVLNNNAGPGLTAANATAVFHGSVDVGKGGCIGFDFGASHTNYPVGLGYVITSQSGSTKGDLAFFTRSVTTDTAPTERMRIDANGLLKSTPTYNNNTGSSANMVVFSDGQFARSTSSRRYKNTINDATHGLTELLTLRPVTYKGNNDGDTVFGGLIAEEVHDAGLTEFVTYNDDGEPDALAYGNMVSLCIKAIQELKTELDEAKARIIALETA